MEKYSNLGAFINRLKRSHLYSPYIVHHEKIGGVDGKYVPFPSWFSKDMKVMLEKQGITRLYKHQIDALNLLIRNKDVIVATPTSSGKSLIYILASFYEILRDPSMRSLFIFPLKALEQDQARAIKEYLHETDYPITYAIYDGDTPPYQRKKIRKNPPHLLITNPDMLHMGILPYHHNWKPFFSNLKYVVLDEAHTYRGIFGSHMVQVIRRLRRICRFYGTDPQFILSSATISNPGQFSELLLGHKVSIVQDDGTSKPPRHFIFIDPKEENVHFMAARLFLAAIKTGLRTIAFTLARKITELIYVWIEEMAPELAKKVSAYRAGFLPEERRNIEKRLANGDLKGVVATSALEMGIDIGNLEVCILVGYPGTLINMWQRSGRVGRGKNESLTILLAYPDALDHYFLHHPGELFSRSVEAVVLDPDNKPILKEHLPCAAAELPLSQDEEFFDLSGSHKSVFNELIENGMILEEIDGGQFFSSRKRPHQNVSLREIGIGYSIIDRKKDRVIGSIDGTRALKETHPGAIYLHLGEQYLVKALHVDRKDVLVERVDVDYYTRVRTEKDTEILEVLKGKPCGNFVIRLARIEVTENIVGYEKRRIRGQELMGRYPLDLPPIVFETVGFWIEIEDDIRQDVERRGLHFMGGIHGLEHLLISVFPLFTLCDRGDIGGISFTTHPQVQKGALFIYDGYPGGVGLAEKGYELIEDLMKRAKEVVSSCECEKGCPSCIHSPKCGSGNVPLDKDATLLILRYLLGELSLRVKEASFIKTDEVKKEGLNLSLPKDHRIAFLDIETKRLAQEVGGWQNAHLMGVSVVVIYDEVLKDFKVYYEKDIEKLFDDLKRFDLIVGFNIIQFDYRVLNPYSPFDLSKLSTFDILGDIKKRVGIRISLDHLARETLGKGKRANGIQAVRWFREGNMNELVTYCQEDVSITRELFYHGVKNRFLVYKRKEGMRVKIPLDWDISRLISQS